MTRLRPEGEEVEIWGGEDTPAGFVWRDGLHQLGEICNRWRVQTRWWDQGQSVSREYLKVTTDTGLLCLLYHDLARGRWFLTRIYD